MPTAFDSAALRFAPSAARRLKAGGLLVLLSLAAWGEAFPSSLSREVANFPAEFYTVSLPWLRQEIDGFGVSSAWTGQDLPEAWADLLFSPYYGIGLSLCRNRVGPDDAYATAMNTQELATVKKAQTRGARVWSTPWTPPAPWKSNASLTQGGHLLPERYRDYADKLARYTAEMKSQGVSLCALSVQNEPDLVTGYESCLWTAAEIHSFVPHLWDALISWNVGSTRILLPEESTWRTTLAAETLSDSQTAPLVGIVAAHGYNADPPPAVDGHGKRLWQTEVADLDTPYDGSMADALRWAANIHAYLVDQSANAWHWWWILPYQDDNSGLLARDGRIPKRLYALGNFSRFVRPGYRRVSCSGSGNLHLSAYRKPDSDRFVVVAINPASIPIQAEISLEGVNPGIQEVTPWVTSPSLSLEPQPPLPIAEGAFTTLLPAQSVTTFVSSNAEIWLNFRAHHESGQTFLVWRDLFHLADTETYDIYASPTPITSLTGLSPVGRVFPAEWRATRLKTVDETLTWSVPSPDGLAPLLADEALFVYTPHTATPAYFAVTPHGRLELDYGNVLGPVSQGLDPVTCYPQGSGVVQGRPFTDFAFWIDGRADAASGRWGFPVMGNATFNGAAHLFRVYSWDPAPSATAQGKLAIWLPDRGEPFGGGLEHQLTGGYLLSLDDYNLILTQTGGSPALEATDTRWIGYWLGFDRFDPARPLPPADGLIVTYTLRRNAWVLTWVKGWLGDGLDLEHAILAGVGQGAAGGDVNLRYRPDLYSAGLFFAGDTTLRLSGQDAYLYGWGPFDGDGSTLATDLSGLALDDLFLPQTRISPDYWTPLKVLVWGVNDLEAPWDQGANIQGRKAWVIDQLSAAGAGALVFWDQRSHRDWANKAWSCSPRLTTAFLADFGKGESYPVFRAESHPKSDPYAAMPLNPVADEDGRNWGTKGGFCNWTVEQDTWTSWSAALWLAETSACPPDAPEFGEATAAVSIGGERRFRPFPGGRILWDLRRCDDGRRLQSGECVADAEGGVGTDGLPLFKSPVRVRLRFFLPPRGDVNLDGLVNALDAALFALGLAEAAPVTEAGWAEADLDLDGTPSARDLADLLQRTTGR